LACARIEDDCAVVAVDDDRFSVPGREELLAETDRHRDAERTRHDRRMGGGGSLG
jgi:hypothetical protein